KWLLHFAFNEQKREMVAVLFKDHPAIFNMFNFHNRDKVSFLINKELNWRTVLNCWLWRILGTASNQENNKECTCENLLPLHGIQIGIRLLSLSRIVLRTPSIMETASQIVVVCPRCLISKLLFATELREKNQYMFKRGDTHCSCFSDISPARAL